jgi:hypothetical protein
MNTEVVNEEQPQEVNFLAQFNDALSKDDTDAIEAVLEELVPAEIARR